MKHIKEIIDEMYTGDHIERWKQYVKKYLKINHETNNNTETPRPI